MNSDEYIDNVMANMKVIGMLQKNSKLCVRKGQLAIDSNNHFQFIRRWFNKDSRDSVMMHARNTINNAIKISKSIMCESIQMDLKDWTLTRINQEMEACELGLVNLKATYMDDAMMVASIDVMVDRLKANREEIMKYYNG